MTAGPPPGIGDGDRALSLILRFVLAIVLLLVFADLATVGNPWCIVPGLLLPLFLWRATR